VVRKVVVNMEILKPNPEACAECRKFVHKGMVIADRFPVRVDHCVYVKKPATCGQSVAAGELKSETSKLTI
jgi:hypothetical protein